MKIKFKKSLISAIALISISISGMIVAACTSETKKSKTQTPKSLDENQTKKQLANQQKQKYITNQYPPLLINDLSKEINFVDNKYWLTFKVNNFYTNKYVVVELKSITNNKQVAISNKAKIDKNSFVKVSFDSLDHNSRYLINKLSVFNNFDDKKPIINKNGLDHELVIKKNNNIKQTNKSICRCWETFIPR